MDPRPGPAKARLTTAYDRVLSLGTDTYSEDPICEFLLTKGCYARIGEIIATLRIPTLFVMKG